MANGAITAATTTIRATRRSIRSRSERQETSGRLALGSTNFGPGPAGHLGNHSADGTGVLFFTAGNGRTVVAADAATGETLWTYRGEKPSAAPCAPTIAASATGAITAANDRILFVTPGYQLVALNAKTGQPHRDLRQRRPSSICGSASTVPSAK